jgi:hypothetical protein
MELLCTAKSAVDGDSTIECHVFMLRDWRIEPGATLEQRRGDEVIATWELVVQTGKSLILKKGTTPAESIELADEFYVQPPVIEQPVTMQATIPVLLFGGKNWKLASPKKWVKANISVEGCPQVGELNIDGQDYVVIKLAEGFAARPRAAS